jgi:CBS domain-containing protein
MAAHMGQFSALVPLGIGPRGLRTQTTMTTSVSGLGRLSSTARARSASLAGDVTDTQAPPKLSRTPYSDVEARTKGGKKRDDAMRVQDVIRTKGSGVITVGETARVKAAIGLMEDRRIGALVVLKSDGRLAGVMSEREVVVALARRGSAALDLLVRDLMIAGGPVVTPTDGIQDAMRIMTEHRTRHLPVVVDSTVVGLLSIGDTVKARLSEKIAENLVLQDIARWPVARVA